jgi:hypothetical protein
MAKGSLVWDGFAEFRAALDALPEDCRAEAATLIAAEVKTAYTLIAAVYAAHRVTGTLVARLQITTIPGGFRLVSGSPIAWLFDNGSQARHWRSGKSTGTMWGKTPPTHIFARTVGVARRTLTARFTAMLTRRGAASVTVTGD